MKKRTLLLAAPILVTLTAQGNAADSIRTVSMDQVVVTATRTPVPLKDAPVLTRVISARDIERSGVGSLPELLEREVAGAEFHQAGYGPTVSFQGLDARYVLFLVNGERMAGETYGNPDFRRLPLVAIERIEIVRGASSLLYGSSAMGAVVNIITRMPDADLDCGVEVRYSPLFQKNDGETLGENASQGELDKYRRNLDRTNLNASGWFGSRIGKLRSMTTLSFWSQDAYRMTSREDETRHYDQLNVLGPVMQPGMPPRPVMDPTTGIPVFEVKRTVADTTINVPPDPRGLSVSGLSGWEVTRRMDYRINDRFLVTASGSYYTRDRYDFRYSITDESPYAAPDKRWTMERGEAWNWKGGVEHTPNARSKVYISVMGDYYKRGQKHYNESLTPKQYHAQIVPRVLWTLNLPQHRLTTGLEAMVETLKFDLNPEGYGKPFRSTSYSAYVQDEIFSTRKLSFVAGVRGDYNDDFGFGFNPKFSAKYSVGRFNIRANYAMGYRAPSLKEMYMVFQIPGTENIIRGNSSLKPETNNYLSVSGEWNTRDVNLSANLYASFFRNKIDVMGREEGAATILEYGNMGHSRMAGLELVGKVRIAKGLVATANYNYLIERNELPAGATQYIYPSPQNAVAKLEYGFNLLSGYMVLNASARYAGRKTYSDMLAIFSMSPMKYMTGNYTARAEDYVLSGAGFEYRIQGVTLGAGVDNLSDYTPPVAGFNSLATPGRTFFFKIGYALKANKR